MYLSITGKPFKTQDEAEEENRNYWVSVERSKILLGKLNRINLAGEEKEKQLEELNTILLNIIDELKGEKIPDGAFINYYQAYWRFKGYTSYLTSINDLAIALNIVKVDIATIGKKSEIERYQRDLKEYIGYFNEAREEGEKKPYVFFKDFSKRKQGIE